MCVFDVAFKEFAPLHIKLWATIKGLCFCVRGVLGVNHDRCGCECAVCDTDFIAVHMQIREGIKTKKPRNMRGSSMLLFTIVILQIHDHVPL